MNETLPHEKDFLKKHPPGVEKFRKRIEFLAKAIAFGASRDNWTPRIRIMDSAAGTQIWTVIGHKAYNDNLQTYLKEIWGGTQPQMAFLEGFGYVKNANNGNGNDYLLTNSAIKLLDEPLDTPKIFISYKRDEGTALALLILARLQARGIENPYIDMQLEGGDNWRKELETTIKNSNTFICILSPQSLGSDNILEEIAWASQVEDMKYIFVTRTDWEECRKNLENCDKNLKEVTSPYPDIYLGDIVEDASYIKIKDFIEEFNWITITGTRARDYNSAIVEILNSIGYTPK